MCLSSNLHLSYFVHGLPVNPSAKIGLGKNRSIQLNLNQKMSKPSERPISTSWHKPLLWPWGGRSMTVANSNTMGLNSSQITKIHQKSNQFWSAFLINLIQNLVPLIASRVRILGGWNISHSHGFFFWSFWISYKLNFDHPFKFYS